MNSSRFGSAFCRSLISVATILGITRGLTFSEDAVVGSKRFRAAGGYTIVLPSDWVQIPNGAVLAFTDQLKQSVSASAIQYPDYGFQLASADRWFTYPYILFQIHNDGRVAESEFKNLPRLDQSIREGAQQGEAMAKSLLSYVQLGKTYYDPTNHVLWITGRLSAQDGRAIRAVSATCLTERGSLQVMCYSTEEDSDRYCKLFENVVNQIVFDYPLKYKLSIVDSIPLGWQQKFAKVFGWIVGGMILAFVLVSFRARKKSG